MFGKTFLFTVLVLGTGYAYVMPKVSYPHLNTYRYTIPDVTTESEKHETNNEDKFDENYVTESDDKVVEYESYEHDDSKHSSSVEDITDNSVTVKNSEIMDNNESDSYYDDDDSGNKSDVEETVDQMPSKKLKCPQDVILFKLPHKSEDYKYYICYLGHIVAMSLCPRGERFEITVQACIKRESSEEVEEEGENDEIPSSEMTEETTEEKATDEIPSSEMTGETTEEEANAEITSSEMTEETTEEEGNDEIPSSEMFEETPEHYTTMDFNKGLIITDASSENRLRDYECVSTHPGGIENFLIPHETDPTQYYICRFGRKFPVPFNCPYEKEFSYYHQVCLPAYLQTYLHDQIFYDETSTMDEKTRVRRDVQNGESISIDDYEFADDSEVDSPEKCPANEIFYKIPHAKYEDHFYVCFLGKVVKSIKGIKTSGKCTFEGLRFDIRTRDCIPRGPITREDCNRSDGLKLLQHSHDLSLFYICRFGYIDMTPAKCPEDYRFNSAEQRCENKFTTWGQQEPFFK